MRMVRKATTSGRRRRISSRSASLDPVLNLHGDVARRAAAAVRLLASSCLACNCHVHPKTIRLQKS
eukprot:6203384-Pleurochrysis_carterae.AAC.2